MISIVCDEPEYHKLSISRDEIRKHCNNVHDWRASLERRTYWREVWVQTFFNAAWLQRYFTVDYEEHDSPAREQQGRPEGGGY